MTRFALLGHPVGHSLSPVMHAASFRALGMEAEYLCFDVAPAELAAWLAHSRDAGFAGLNITVPHKVAAFGLMDRLDSSARLYGAVNTVRMDSDGLTGFNTDADGFWEDLALNFGRRPLGTCIMIVGCGGAGRALAISGAARGAASVVLANRTPARAAQVADEIARMLPQAADKVRVAGQGMETWVAAAREADLVVQCTSAGLEADAPALLPSSAFRPGQLLYDIIYTRRVTPTMAAAAQAGAETANGIGMLVYQGAAAFGIWMGASADTQAMRRALEAELY